MGCKHICGGRFFFELRLQRPVSMKTVFFSLVVVGLAAGGAAYYTKRLAADSVVSFRTAAIKRDNLGSTDK
jgi:hypothetical protein